MEPQELVLLYGLPASHAEGDLAQRVLRDASIPMREVQPQELGLPVGTLAGLDDADNPPKMVEPFPVRAMVFCGFSEQRLREVLTLLRESGIGSSVLKAVLTVKNRDWRFYDLLAELKKEREAFARMVRAGSQGGTEQNAKQDT